MLVSMVETADSDKIGDLPGLLARQVEAGRDQLSSQYLRVLRENLFASRAELRPSALGRIAAQEVDALLEFLRASPASPSLERGSQLCQAGLGEDALLGLGRVTRQFFIAQLEHDLIAPALDLLDAYQSALIRGFMQRREEIVLIEQEDIRKAFELAISRFTVEIKEIQTLAQQATEANKFRSRFIARISHELRTPLGGLLGLSDMLQHEVYGPLTPAQQDIVQRIINNVRILERVFSEFLDQTQIETGQLQLRDSEFSPRMMAQSVHSNYLPMALQKGLAMHLHVDPDLPRVLIGDSKRIEQILTNLVVNAIKFTETGSVTVYVYKNEDAHWALQVKDTGIGISKKAQAYIFEPFRQADEAIERVYDGIGLGLSIVQQLVIAMQGTVSLESKIGQGSTFTVTLPLRVARDEYP